MTNENGFGQCKTLSQIVTDENMELKAIAIRLQGENMRLRSQQAQAVSLLKSDPEILKEAFVMQTPPVAMIIGHIEDALALLTNPAPGKEK